MKEVVVFWIGGDQGSDCLSSLKPSLQCRYDLSLVESRLFCKCLTWWRIACLGERFDAAAWVSNPEVNRFRNEGCFKHHASQSFEDEYFALLIKHRIEFDERSVFYDEIVG